MPARQLEPCRAGTVHAAPARFDCVYIGAKNRSSTMPAQLAFWCKRGITRRCNTYKEVHNNNVNIISRHLDMVKN